MTNRTYVPNGSLANDTDVTRLAALRKIENRPNEEKKSPKNQQKKSLPKTLPSFFWHFLKQKWRWFVPMQVLYCAWAIDHTLFPYVISLLIDAITQFQGDRSQIWAAVTLPLVMGAILWLGVEVCYRFAGFLNSKASPWLESNIRMSLFEHCQHHSYSYFSSNFAGSLSNKIADMPNSATDILHLIMPLFVPVLVAIVISTTFFANLQPWFAVILLSWVIVHISIALIFSKRCAQYSNVHAEARTALSGKIVDSFTNHLNVRLFARHPFEKDYLSKYQKEERQKNTVSLRYIEKMKIALGIPAFLGPGVALNWYMIYCWQQGLITAGEVVFIFNTSWNILMMAWVAGLEIPTFFKEVGVCKQALTLVQDQHDIVDEPQAKPMKVTKGEIAFENVTFHYTPDRKVFRNKNIVIEAGTKVGLIGFSGSGKTTFVHLILRYFDVEEGRILIDGQDIALATQDSLRSQIAMIPQDASLFHRTLMENIRYGRPDATDEEVIEAAKQASCHEFIEKMPEKYHTYAGERGVKLSGGQRQRISIARAILKNARILILDEATSALDSVTEKQIQEDLGHLMEGRTAIVIAHRLSTLSGMDRILVFKEGEIVEDGSHEELLMADGHYAMMWNMQAGGFLPDSWEWE